MNKQTKIFCFGVLLFLAGSVITTKCILSKRTYKMSVTTLLSSYKENPSAFKAKYDKHIVYVTGRVYFVFFGESVENYVYKSGSEYTGSFVQLMDPAISAESDIKEFYKNSIRCGFYKKNRKMFENMDYLNPLKKIIITVKGTLYVDKEEVLLVDCLKIEK